MVFKTCRSHLKCNQNHGYCHAQTPWERETGELAAVGILAAEQCIGCLKISEY